MAGHLAGGRPADAERTGEESAGFAAPQPLASETAIDAVPLDVCTFCSYYTLALNGDCPGRGGRVSIYGCDAAQTVQTFYPCFSGVARVV